MANMAKMLPVFQTVKKVIKEQIYMQNVCVLSIFLLAVTKFLPKSM